MDYTTAITAVEDGDNGNPVYAARTSWPLVQYIGKGADGLLEYGQTSGGQAYSPTADDLGATNWIKGGDRPPHRP